MSPFKVNLSEELTEDMFVIHEETLDEMSLFNLHNLCDKIMTENPNAKFDGGFKIRLPESLQGTGSTLEDFWEQFTNASNFLSSLYLTCDNESTGVMRFESRKVLARENVEFKRAAKDQQTFDSTRRNCCMMALDEGGPKSAVIHFYECLFSKAIVNSDDSITFPSQKTSKINYRERQTCIIDNDPSLTCMLVESSMKDKKYLVQDSASLHSPAVGPSEDYRKSVFNALEPRNLTPDGDGENCSLYFNGVEESCSKFLYVTSNFALAHLCHLNMLTDLQGYYSGISFPFVYLGGLHSVFPIHVEDMSLWSINYNHMGHPKLIILIAPSEVSRLSFLLATYGMGGIGQTCIQQLHHKSDIVFPQWLLKHGIRFKVVILHPGEFFVFAPNAAHTGGNMGPNLAEACNFGTNDWLPFGSVASLSRCYCFDHGVQFDVTQLISDHRKELLPYHQDKAMWTSFRDDHFQRSLIIPPGACYPPTSDSPILEPSATTQSAYKSAKKQQGTSTVTMKRERVECPVEECLKTYQLPVKKDTLMSHILQEHPQQAKRKKIIREVDSLCSTKDSNTSTSERYTCTDCGASVSINSTRHKNSNKCKERSVTYRKFNV